jgi:hypothetical protein
MPAYPRGSEWRRWDLHVHSPLSVLSNEFPRLQDGEPDWDTYVAALEQQPIAVYGITDYFTVEGYKHLRRAQREEGRLRDVRLLPNIEFRLDQFVGHRGDGRQQRRLNFHVIFSDEVEPSDIEDHFLHDLNFAYQENPTDPTERLSLKVANLSRLGERLTQEHAAFRGQPAVRVGAMNAVVGLTPILDTLKKDRRFDNKYLLLLPADGWNDIPWDGQDHQTRKTLLQAADIVLASNPNTISWCLGRAPYTDGEESFCREFRTLKPCVHGSDAHAVPFIGHPCGRRGETGHDCAANRENCDLRNCWIKADPTFEGLRQLLYEPADRVKIQPADPTPSKSIFSLTHFGSEGARVNDELTIAPLDMPLNSGMVAVTGGKGSGKTALVDLIAHAFSDREHTEDRNSFVRRIADSSSPLAFSLSFARGDQFAKTLGDRVFFDDSRVVYIAQGELEKYIDQNSDLNEYIHRLIFRSGDIKDTVDAFDYETQEGTTQSLQADLDAKNGAIVALEEATAGPVTESTEKAGKQAKAELEDVSKRLKDFETKLSKDKIDENTKKQEVVAQVKRKRDQLAQARDLAGATIRAIDNDLKKIAETIAALNKAIQGLGLGDALPTPSYPDRQRVVDVRDGIEQQLRDVVAQIEKGEREIKLLADDMREHNKLLTRRQEVQTLHGQLQERWKQLQSSKQQLVGERAIRTQLLTQVLESIAAQRQRYGKVIGTFTQAKDAILSDLDFAAQVFVSEDGLFAAVENVVDNRQVPVAGVERGESALSRLLDMLHRFAGGDDATIREMVEETDRLASEFASRLKKSAGMADLYHALYSPYLSVHPVALYKQTTLDKLSLGQKATVLIKIYLAEGDLPIVIDSHDDHLDNEYIMAELVGAIRHAKSYRQVIIASNNGNVVVNSDAEQVIVAQRRDGAISYTSGALEDPEIRALALNVLEGGQEAFRKRQEKYRIKAR